MTISLILAMARNRVIGKDNALPWHMPADLKYFKRVTLGKPVIMGRKTFEAIGKPLPGRINIIVTRDTDFQAASCTVVHSIEAALDAAQGHAEIMVIGGARLFEQVLSRAQRIYLTEIEHDVMGDAWFPELKEHEWRTSWREAHAADEHNPHAYRFIVLDRNTSE